MSFDIVVAGNGPSSAAPAVQDFPAEPSRLFRTNYFFLPEQDRWGHDFTDWFLCEVEEDCRCALAFLRGRQLSKNKTFWFPGIRSDICNRLADNQLAGHPVRLQRKTVLPDACRWEKDLAPYRPLMGSFAIAVAVGMQPDTLYLCGHDLFSGGGNSHAGLQKDTRAWQADFNRQYLANRHRNHRLQGDIDYIGKALRAYRGHVVSVGTVLKDLFSKEFPAWEWIEG